MMMIVNKMADICVYLKTDLLLWMIYIFDTK